MIAVWMLYASACALGLLVAAAVVERVLLAGRISVRYVWAGAVALSLVVPVVAHRYATRRVVAPVAATVIEEPPADSLAQVLPPSNPAATPAPAPRAQAPAVAAAPRANWRDVIARSDDSLIAVWLVLSGALVLHFALGFILLARTRRSWTSRVVMGVPVLVSETTGPALVGAVAPVIVMPRWALTLGPVHLALMLRHEQEHQRARDGQLLFAAQCALIAMPWNPALWWQVSRLRVAVELDCDARVLRDADERAYGNLLLEVVRPRTILAPMGIASFAERATQLERRILVMANRKNGRTLRGARAMAGIVALSTGTIAWLAPRPDVPITAPLVPGPPPATAESANSASETPASLAGPTTRNQRPAQPAPAAVATSDTARPSPVIILPPVVPDTTPVRGDTTPTVQVPIPGSGGRGRGNGVPAPPPTVDLTYNLLFADITLNADQQAKARSLIDSLLREQVAIQDSVRNALAIYNARVAELRGIRDSVLLALPSTDVERDLLRPRLGGPAGGGQRGGGRGNTPANQNGRGGAPLDSIQLAEVQYVRLFEGIQLSPDREARAKQAIARWQSEQRAMSPPRGRQVLIPRPFNNTVLIDVRADSTLMSLLTNDTDRQKLRDRMVNPPPPIQLPGR